MKYRLFLLFTLILSQLLVGNEKPQEGDLRYQDLSLLTIDYTLPIELDISKKDFSVFQKGTLVGTTENDNYSEYAGYNDENGVPCNHFYTRWKLYNNLKQLSMTATAIAHIKPINFNFFVNDLNVGNIYWNNYHGKTPDKKFHTISSEIYYSYTISGFGKFYDWRKITTSEIVVDHDKLSGEKEGMTLLDFNTREVIAYMSQDQDNWHITVYNDKKINIDILIFIIIGEKSN